MRYGLVFLAATLLALLVGAMWPQGVASRAGMRLALTSGAGAPLPGSLGLEAHLERRRRRRARSARLAASRQLGWSLTVLLSSAWLLSTAWRRPELLALGLAAGLAGCLVWLNWQRLVRRRVADQLPEAVHLLAQTVQQSNSLYRGYEAVSQQAPEAVACCFRTLLTASNEGLSEPQALAAMVRQAPSEEIALLAAALEAPSLRGRALGEALGAFRHILVARHGRRRARRRAWHLACAGLGLLVVEGGLGAAWAPTHTMPSWGPLLAAAAWAIAVALGLWGLQDHAR